MSFKNPFENWSQRDILLSEAISCIIHDEMRLAVIGKYGHVFDLALVRGSGIGGDPGWQIKHMTETSGPGSFLIEVGPEPWSSELSKECYSAHEVFAAIEDHLNDYAVRHQEHKDVVGKVLAYLPDYWNRL